MFTFYLVRHGNTEHNADGRIMGQIDSPLTPEGIKDAQWLGKKLASITFNAIYSSDLGRAFITAYIINQNRPERLDIMAWKELRETNYGIYQNCLKSEASKKCSYSKIGPSYVFPDGESASQTQQRAVSFINKIEKELGNQTALIVTHSGLIRTIVSHFNNLLLANNLNLEITHRYVGRFEIENGRLKSYKIISN